MASALLKASPYPRTGHKMRDRDIRTAVFQKIIVDHVTDPRTLVVEELGLQHGASRVDIAVVNGVLHGYEIKSEVDTLERLPAQIVAYSRVLDRATLVTAENHLNHALELIPTWWGVKVATRGTRGAIHFATYRRSDNNPSVSAFHVAQLLWRNEVTTILETLGVDGPTLRTNRAGLYKLLSERLSLNELRLNVRDRLKARKDWRCP